MAYVQFDSTRPIGTDDGPEVVVSANANDCALRDAIVMGQMHGFVFSCSGGTARQPTTMLWTNSAIIIKAVVTWGTMGGANYNITAVAWSLSTDSGSTYNAIDSQTFTYDTNGNLTATTATGGFSSWLISLIGRMSTAEASITTLIGDIAALGTMAGQNANAVAVTGGTLEVTYERNKTTAIGNLNASQAIDWKAQGFVTLTVTGSSAVFTWSNLPPGGSGGMSGALLMRITNGGLSSGLFANAKVPAGMTLSSSGTDWVSVACVDGTHAEVIGVTLAVA